MKLIFLDIDGVLNNGRHATLLHEKNPGLGFGRPWALDDGDFSVENVGWDPKNVDALMHIVNETGAEIIISSTWRIGRRLPFFRQCFKVFNVCPPILGMTGQLHNRIRGDEVDALLEKVEADSWVCLDDDGDFHPHNNLIQTDFDIGLTMEQAEEAIDILKGEVAPNKR